MWQEARRQEKKLRGMMVDYRKRAERRRAFYERMKLDPTQFLRVYGQKCKIHIDPQLAAAGDGKSVMMPWQGDSNNMIDRFDVRAHLDIIPEQPSLSTMGPLMETNPEEHRLNYERYRTLVMIDCSGVSEESYIRQLEVEEMYGVKKDDDKKEKEKSQAKATIGFTYDNASAASSDKDDEDSDSDSDSVLSDIDVTVDVDEIDASQRETLDAQGLHYGMASAQFCRKLKEDKEEIEEQRRLRQEEEERSLVTGRRAKRERRSIREKQRRRAHDLEQSPPSYARKASPTYEPYSRSSSRSSSRSHSPEDAGKVEFITEFSHKDDNPSTKKVGGDSQSHTISSRTSERKKSKERDRSQSHKKHRSRTRSRSRSRSRDRDRRRYRDRSRSRSRDRSQSRNRSRSRDRDRHGGRGQDRYKRSRSRSRSRDRDRKERDSLRVADNKDWRALPSKALGLLKNKATPSSGSKDKMTTQEKMKKRMQMMLNKQLKTDKKEDRRKRDVKEQERREREDDLREMQRKWRERDRERDRYDRSRSSSPRGRRRSESRSPPRRRHTSRSRSGSPIESQKIPVVDIDARAMGEDVVEYVYPVKKER